jgi:hypothetical protein
MPMFGFLHLARTDFKGRRNPSVTHRLPSHLHRPKALFPMVEMLHFALVF